MSPETRINALMTDLNALSPSGFTMAAHMSISHPRFLFRTYTKDWNALYSARGYVLKDPVFAWCMDNDGTIAWSDIENYGDQSVLTHAAQFDLAHGIAHSIWRGNSRSVCAAARADRPFTNTETAQLVAIFEQLHDLTAHTKPLAPNKLTMLCHQSIKLQ